MDYSPLVLAILWAKGSVMRSKDEKLLGPWGAPPGSPEPPLWPSGHHVRVRTKSDRLCTLPLHSLQLCHWSLSLRFLLAGPEAREKRGDVWGYWEMLRDAGGCCMKLGVQGDFSGVERCWRLLEDGKGCCVMLGDAIWCWKILGGASHLAMLPPSRLAWWVLCLAPGGNTACCSGPQGLSVTYLLQEVSPKVICVTQMGAGAGVHLPLPWACSILPVATVLKVAFPFLNQKLWDTGNPLLNQSQESQF